MKQIIKPINKELLDKYLQIPDLTIPETQHAVNMLYEKIKDFMTATHSGSEIIVVREIPIVSPQENYDDLLISKDNISRSSTYTHYLGPDKLLRTHTTAHISKVLRSLAKQTDWEDVIILLPGLVYRRDVTDRKHLGIFHQLEMWRVVRNTARDIIHKQDLLNVIDKLAKTACPGWDLRIVDMPHPYTKEGVEVNAVKDDRDIEILESGLINDQILQNCELSPKEYSGWALGMGLDRLVMTLKNIPDIRYLRSANPRIAKQMKNLDQYVEISDQPAIRRDMSYCVPADYVEEDLNEEIRMALGIEVEILEEVQLLSETAYKDLPAEAVTRLGCKPEQKNVLMRITLRHLEKTLTKNEANALYRRIYAEVNYGDGGYLSLSQ